MGVIILIKLGNEIELKTGFPAWSGICKNLQLLKWGNRKRAYAVFGTIFDSNNICKGSSPVFEGNLKACREYCKQKELISEV